MEHPNARVVRELYEARERGDLEAVRALLAGEVVWHEPELDPEHTGDLRGPDAVLAMIEEAQRITEGTFALSPREIVANGEHAVALIDWSAMHGGKKLEGREVAVYRFRGGSVVEASFHQDNPDADREFWK